MMREKAFQNLVRIAVEIEELEQSALAPPNWDSDSSPVISIGRIVFRRKHIRRLTVPLAAAIALLCLLRPAARPVSTPTVSHVASVNAALVRPFDIAVCPVEFTVRDGYEHSAGEETLKVVAIFQTWKKECECHVWQLYEWEDDRSLADMTPEQIHEITMDVTGAPPLEELQVVAIARNSADLPLCIPESCELVECLNQVSPTNDARDNSVAYATAVRDCLPDTVRVIPQSLFQE